MIARLAIIQRYNANYYYTIQTLTDVYSMNEPYTEFSASLFIVSFEFAGFSRHSLRLYPFSPKQKNPTVLFSLPVLDIRQSYLFLIWRARSQEMLYGMKSRVTHLQHLYRCGRGILPWCLASSMTIVSDARLVSLWSDFLCLRHLCSDRPFCSPFHGLILWADSFEYVLSFNFAVQPKKFVVKVSPYEMDNYVYCITLAWLLWRFAFDAVMASKGFATKH